MERLEQELKIYFRCEVEAAAPPQDWWQKAASIAVGQPQEESHKPKTGFRAWASNLVEILRINPRKPIWGVVTYLLLLVVYAGLSAGLTNIVSNFPPGGMSAPPITTGLPSTTIPGTTIPPGSTMPPGTTQPPIGPPVTITNTSVIITSASSSADLHSLIFILIFSLFIVATLLIQIRSWKGSRDYL